MEEKIVHSASQPPVVSKDQIANMSRSYFSKTEIGKSVFQKLVWLQILELQELQKFT